VALAIALLLLGFFKPLTPYPTYTLNDGELIFDGRVAYDELQQFVTRYPYRFAGSEASLNAAKYISSYFSELGLTVELQEFTTFSPFQTDHLTDLRGNPLNKGMRISEIFQPFTAQNVIGFLPGKSKQTVVVGAHRDIISTTQGAEDNGSGTIVMLQLARILSQAERNLSYIFVSYDAEEVSIMGSERFINHYKDLDITLAISLDMLGWNEADTVGFYPFSAAGKRTPLWVYSLAKQMSDFTPHNSFSIWHDLAAASKQLIPTDTHPFARRGIPVLGVVAINSEYGSYIDHRPIHTPADSLEIVSPETLHRTGRFMEQYLLTIESGAIDRGYSSLYIPFSQGIIPPWYVGLAYTVLFLGLVLLLGLDIRAHNKSFGLRVLRKELPWLLGATLVAVGTTLFWFNLFSAPIASLHIIGVAIIGFGLPCIGLLGLAYWRRKRSLTREHTRFIYSAGLLALLLMGLLAVGYHKAVIMTLIPIVMGGYAPIIWLGLFFPIFLTLLSPHLLSFFTTQTLVFFAWAVLLWSFTGVFALSKPKQARSKQIVGDWFAK